MEKQESRIACRIPSDLRKKVDSLVQTGQYLSLSDLVRAALERLLKENPREHE